MAITINGVGTIGGITAGGLPDACVTAADLAVGAAKANYGAGAVLQVVQTVKTDVFTSSSTSFVDVTGLSATITPSNASSKILVITYAVLSNTNIASNYYSHLRMMRGAIPIFVGDAAGTRSRSAFMAFLPNNGGSQAGTITYLDSPATASSTTYTMQILSEGGGTAAVGRTGPDGDHPAYGRFPASIILMEIAA